MLVNARKGDLISIEYTGRVASSGAVFDTTSEEIAKLAGIFDPAAQYGSKLTFFGANAIISGIEEAILTSKLGQSEEFTFSPDKAFGSRDASLVRVLSEKEFRKQNLRPVPGMVISLDGALARVKSTTSGRVVVDFNHPLAGEAVTYSLKVIDVISEPAKKAEALARSLGLSATASEKGGKVTLAFQKGADIKKVEAAKRTILAVVPGTEFA